MKKWTKLLSVFVLASAITVGGAAAAGCHKTPVDPDEPGQDTPSDLYVPVSNVTIKGGTTNLNVGEKLNLIAEVTPAEATNKEITWSTSDASVATVSSSGVVTAVGAGEVTITAKSANNIAGICTITVGIAGEHNHTYTDWVVKTVPSKDEKGEATRECNNKESACAGAVTTKELPVLSETDYDIEAGSAEGKSKYTLKADETISFEAISLDFVEVTEVALNKGTARIVVGDTLTLNYTVSPENATNQAVTWKSSNEAVATVADGVVTAKAKGTAVITVTTADGNKTATCTVTVAEASDPAVSVESVTLNKTEGTLKKGETLRLTPTIAPADAANQNVQWTSSDEAVATVHAGVVTAKGKGTATITATTVDGGKTATCAITVTEAEEPVAHNHSYGEWTVKTTPGKETEGEATRTCGGAGECDGELTKELPVLSETDYTIEAGSAEGKSKYTLKADKTISFEADSLGGGTVVTPPAGEASIELNKTVLGLIKGKTEKLTATVTAGEGVNKDVTWSTSSESVATVSSDGTVTAVAKGNAIITAKVGDKEATCTVTVIEEVADPDAPQIENVVYELHSAVTGGKLAEKTADSVYGVYAEKNNATEYVQSGASGYTQTINNKDGSNNAQANRSIYISFAKLGGKIEGYFELSASAVGSKWDIVQFNAKDSEGASVKKFCMNVTGNNGVVKYNKGNNNETSAQTNPETALTMAVNTKIKVLYKIVKDGANYKLTISVDGKPFVTNLDIGTDAIEQITLPSSSAGTRLLTIDNVIIGAESIDESVKTVESVTLNKSELELNVGGTETLTATVTPTDAYNATVIWSTSDATVATVDANGKVTAVDGGAAIITAKAGGKEAKCIVTVAITMYTVTFVNDGETVDTVVAQSGSKVTAPVVTKEGYTLSWAIGSVSGAKFDPAQEVVEGNMTLHAVWTEGTTNPPVVNPPVVNPPTIPVNSTIKFITERTAADQESAYVSWEGVTGAEWYSVYCISEDGASVKLDDELVRAYPDYYRADAVGLKAGSYSMKVVPLDASGNEMTSSAGTVTGFNVIAHERTGYAFVDGTSSGAYNEDGTLQKDAVVLYVTNKNYSTVSLTTSKGTTITGIDNILGEGYTTKNGFEKPLCVRIVGSVGDGSKLGFKASGDLELKGLTQGVTVEGIGEDATANGWGFHITGCSNVEVRNIGIMNMMGGTKDGVGFEGKCHHVWVHNCDFFYGHNWGGDQAKGDGSLDTKVSTNVTHSYNHFWDSGKCNLQGMKSDTTDLRITYHHNWYDHSDSRHPRIRAASVHIYNNYFDGNAKYCVGVTKGANAFVENNYFRSTAPLRPMMSSQQGTDALGDGTFSGEDGGMIKAFGNKFDCSASNLKLITQNDTADKSGIDCYLASSRNEKVPSEYKAKVGGTAYNNFDTADFYEYTVDTPDVAKQKCETYAGRINGGDLKFEFDNATQDPNYALIPEVTAGLNAYKGTVVKIGKDGK